MSNSNSSFLVLGMLHPSHGTNCETIHQSSRTKCIEYDKVEYYKCYYSVF